MKFCHQLILLILFSLNCLMGQSLLQQANSKYLRSHADNPVHWYPWGTQAQQIAKQEDKLMVISIGYSSCHWCHVMEEESFMDTVVANYMNEHFISVKVDREERPDIDQVYTEAAIMLTGNAGWPLNIIALPDGKPVFAGTYYETSAWMKLLSQAQQLYKNAPERVQQNAEAITRRLQKRINPEGNQTEVFFDHNQYRRLYNAWKPFIDDTRGGFRQKEKFPLPGAWKSMLQYHYLTGDERAYKSVLNTLEAIRRGGIYDHLEGGFFRYSTDQAWFEPHFEKMLYDQAQLVELYADANKVEDRAYFTDVIRQTLTFVENHLTGPEGGFYSGVNAISEGENGLFYLWRYDELKKILAPQELQLVTDFYTISEKGNYQNGWNILHVPEKEPEFARRHKYTEKEWLSMLQTIKGKMLEYRSQRVYPSIDKKIITAWNALMLKGYLSAYKALGEAVYLQRAVDNANFLYSNLYEKNGKVYHSLYEGERGSTAFLDDYALLADAWFQLYEVTFNIKWLQRAKSVANYALKHFGDSSSPLLYYHDQQEAGLFIRNHEIYDDFIPSSNALMAKVLFKLGHVYYASDYLEICYQMFHQVSDRILTGGPNMASWAQLGGLLNQKPYEIAITGPNAVNYSRILQKKYLPNAIFMGGQEENLPLLENKMVDGETIIYVCQNKVCKMPVKKPEKALQLMN